MLQITPGLHALRRAFPGAVIDAVVRNPPCARVLRFNPDIDEVIVYDKAGGSRPREALGLFLNIRKKRYTMSITHCVDFDFKTGLFALSCGIPERIGPSVGRHGVFYSKRIPVSSRTHCLDRNFDLVRAAADTPPPEDDAFRFFLVDEERTFARRFLEMHGLSSTREIIGIHPGGGPWRKVRRWPKERYIELIQALDESPDRRVLVFGGPDETALVNGILEKVGPGVIPANETLTLGQFCALIQCCTLFVCNDGGPLQLAAAVGAPSVAIVGPTDPAAFAPRGKRHAVVTTNHHCSPCIDYYDYASDGCEEMSCMSAITVAMVLSVIRERLENRAVLRRLGP